MDSAATNGSTPARRIVVVGGGIGGAETALTLAIGLPDADVTLVSRWGSIRLLPDLVYVPFGVSPRRIDVPVGELMPHGVRSLVAEVEHVDVHQRILQTSDGLVPYDVLVVAPGAEPRPGYHTSLRSLDDAHRLRGDLAALVADARQGERRTITIRAESDDSWTAPAVEMALLVGAFIRSRGLQDRIETMFITSDSCAFEWFGSQGEKLIESAFRRARVKLATGVPAGRFDELGGDLDIDFGALQPRAVSGLPGIGPSGWYEPDDHLRVAPDVFVVGDALRLPYRAGFATAWEARHVLRTLGGDIMRLGLSIDGIPADAVEYQMDLADSVLRARLPHAESLAHPFLGHDAEVSVSPGGRPDKLQGLVLHDRVLRWHDRLHDAPLAFRDVLRDREAASA
ncbi:MAG: FAD-dependent oxidoreductase [Thermoleophilia bacterium]|nr:FAD-dependent oxidoreductase [Thermoleophilia bacterium]